MSLVSSVDWKLTSSTRVSLALFTSKPSPAPQLGDLGLEQTQMLHGGIVLLCAGILGFQFRDLVHAGRHAGQPTVMLLLVFGGVG